MSHPVKDSRSRPKRQKASVRIFIGCLYLAISVLLIGWELQEQGNLFSNNECDLRSSPQGESRLLNPAYRWLLPHVLPAASGRVAVVAIESNLEAIQQNVCPARAFTAYLLEAIAMQRPSVIAIDRFYSDNACDSSDPDTKKLTSTIGALGDQGIAVVVGQSTQPARNDPSESCLAMTPQLSLGEKVQRGLTRLNQDILRLPLQWPVLLHDGDAKPTFGPEGYSFPLAAAAQVDHTLVTKLESAHLILPTEPNSTQESQLLQQPFVNLTWDFQPISATALFCSTGDPVAFARWKEIASQCAKSLDKGDTLGLFDLREKVVVLGAQSEIDFPSVLGKGMYGFELQAHYIDALLAKRGYIRTISSIVLLIPLALYFVLSELAIPYMHIHLHPRWPLFHIELPLVWTIGLWFLTMVLGVVVPLLFQRFPPLEILIGISGILISRLLIEGWALVNERSEGPGEEGLA